MLLFNQRVTEFGPYHLKSRSNRCYQNCFSKSLIQGMEMEHNPVPKIRAFNRRILKVIEQMPEDYVYRTTVQGLIEEQAALVDQFEGDIALLEEKIGAPMEMHIRSLKRELRAARGLVEDQVRFNVFCFQDRLNFCD